MDKAMFDKLVESCNEAIEHEKGNIKLHSTVVSIPDDEMDTLYFNKLVTLPQPAKKKGAALHRQAVPRCLKGLNIVCKKRQPYISCRFF